MTEKQTYVQIQAEQVVGNCQLSGISVSKKDQDIIERIIAGELDAKPLRAELVKQYKSKDEG